MGGGRKLSDHLSDDFSSSSSSSSSELSSAPSCSTYLDLLQSYENPPQRNQSLQHYKDAILRHRPGDWIEEVGGLTKADYDVPEVTTLLLVGPRGSGKSSLINRITRVFEEDKFGVDRAQVFHNLSVTNGSCFLQEYMIPRNSKSLCFYDSRSLSTCKSENFSILNGWMTQGVSHGRMVIRDSDTVLMKEEIKAMARQHQNCFCQTRFVNFVIFVVDGVSVLKSMDGKDGEYSEMLIENFNYPYLSFKGSLDLPLKRKFPAAGLLYDAKKRLLSTSGYINSSLVRRPSTLEDLPPPSAVSVQDFLRTYVRRRRSLPPAGQTISDIRAF